MGPQQPACPAITENEMGFGLPGWVGQHFADEAVEPQLDAGGRLLCALYVSQPAESKVGIFQFPSFRVSSRWQRRVRSSRQIRSCRILVPSFLFFPVVREFHRAPAGNVVIFSFPEYPIEHSGSAEQSDIPTAAVCSGRL